MGGFGIGDFFFVDDGGGAGWHPGNRDPRLSLFAQGREAGAARPTAGHALMLYALCGADGNCPGATDDEALGLLAGWARVESWVFARKLDVVRELSRRRPSPAGDEHLAREVSLELGLSVQGARKLIDLAWALEVRVPRIGQALGDGLVDPSRARMIADETSVLEDPAMLARAEQVILDGLGKCRTWSDLQRLVQRAVCTVDPEGARKRRERAEREEARLRFWREASGTCALMGTGLPADETLAAMAHVEQRAQEYRRAGVKRYIEILRVAACLDLLNGVSVAERISLFRAEDTERANSEARPAAGTEPGAQAHGDGQTEANPAGEAGLRQDEQARTKTDGQSDAGHTDAGPADTRVTGTRPAGTGHTDAGHTDEAATGAYGHPETEPASAGTRDNDTPVAWPALDNEWPNDWPTEVPPCGYCDQIECRCGDPGWSEGPGPCGPDPGGGARLGGPSFAARTNLTLPALDIPLLTALGLARRPGEARRLGALDPALACRLAKAAALNPNSEFCVTVVDSVGHAIGHGCARPLRDRKASSRDRETDRSDIRESEPRDSRTANRSERAGPDRERDGPPPPAGTFTFTPAGKPGPAGGFGSWILTVPRTTPLRTTPPGTASPGARPTACAVPLSATFTVDLYRVPTGECDHAYESAGHDPTSRLRHLVQVRDGKCGFPTCSRHARESDIEHATPHDKGGAPAAATAGAAAARVTAKAIRPLGHD